MINTSLRALIRRPVGVIIVAFGMIALTASPAAAATTAESAGFPLIGWLSFIAVAGLGLMPILLWMRFRSGLEASEPGARAHHAVRDQGDAPHPFA